MDSREKDSGRVVGHTDWCLLSPFDLSWILLVGGSLLVLRSLPGPPVVRELMQVVTILPGQGGQFQSVVPLTKPASGHWVVWEQWWSVTQTGKEISVSWLQGWAMCFRDCTGRGEHRMHEPGLSFGLKTFEIFVKRIEDTYGTSQ